MTGRDVDDSGTRDPVVHDLAEPGYDGSMINEQASISDDDMNSAPTEDEENLDAPGEHSKDTGDEPTEDDENLDSPGEHSKDTGDEA